MKQGNSDRERCLLLLLTCCVEDNRGGTGVQHRHRRQQRSSALNRLCEMSERLMSDDDRQTEIVWCGGVLKLYCHFISTHNKWVGSKLNLFLHCLAFVSNHLANKSWVFKREQSNTLVKSKYLLKENNQKIVLPSGVAPCPLLIDTNLWQTFFTLVANLLAMNAMASQLSAHNFGTMHVACNKQNICPQATTNGRK